MVDTTYLIGSNAGTGNDGTTKKSIIGGSNNTLIGTGTAVNLAGANNRTVIGKGAIGKANNSVTLGNSSVTAVYASDDSGATLYAGGLNLGGTAVTADAAELNYLDGVTSNIQTQIDNAGGASSLNGLSDVLAENQSFFIGNIPGSTNGAYYSVSLGTNSLNSVTTADYNTAIGQESLENLTTGHKNTAIGAQSLRYVTGTQNTGLGYAGPMLIPLVVIRHAGLNTDPSGNGAINHYQLTQ